MFCASIKLEIHSPGNTNKMTDVRALTCTAFYFIYKNFTVSLYNRKICLLLLHQAYGSGEINKQTNSWNS